MKTKSGLSRGTETLNFLSKNKFPLGIDNLIVTYTIDNPWTEFTDALLNKNSVIAIWLQDIFKFHNQMTKEEIQECYEIKICLAEQEFQTLYRNLFACKFVENKFIYNPYAYFMTVLKNKSPNYENVIGHFDRVCTSSGKNTILREIVEFGCIDAMKFAVEKLKWKLDEEFAIKEFTIEEFKIHDEEMLRYLYSMAKNQSYKHELRLICLNMLRNYIRENDDIKKITEYCELHENMIREAIISIEYGEQHPVINLMCPIFKKLKIIDIYYSSDEEPEIDSEDDYKMTDPKKVVCLIKMFPPTSAQIGDAKNIVVNYLQHVNNGELQDCIEKIIGGNL